MILALASPHVASSVEEGLEKVQQLISAAAVQGAQVVCFPEAYLPGLRGMDFDVPDFTTAQQEQVLEVAGDAASENRIGVILGMERLTDGGRQIAAAVFNSDGELEGVQTKNQLDPSEDAHYIPGCGRRLFQVHGLKFGVVICHEGFRYPETVRWAAVRGAQVVFHPHCTGSDQTGAQFTRWGSLEAPYYERAMSCRALENEIYFAGVNYALRYQESATCFISPSGACIAQLPYGEEGVLVCDLDLEAASGRLAARYAPERHQDETPA